MAVGAIATGSCTTQNHCPRSHPSSLLTGGMRAVHRAPSTEIATALKLRLARAASAQQKEFPSPRVAVVGAGLAGIAASIALAETGFVVELLEAESRIGGRVLTAMPNDHAYDLGATWVHGKTLQQNPMLGFAPPPNNVGHLRHRPMSNSVREVRWVLGETGKPVANGSEPRRFANDYANALRDCEGVAHGKPPSTFKEIHPEDVASAVESLLDQRPVESSADNKAGELSSDAMFEVDLARRAYHWRQQFECCISGCNDVAELSLEAWGESEQPPGAKMAAKYWRGGFSDLLKTMQDVLPETVILRTGCRVERIEWQLLAGPDKADDAESVDKPRGGAARLLVNCGCGHDAMPRSKGTCDIEAIHADHVIFTASLGVLKGLVGKGDGSQTNDKQRGEDKEDWRPFFVPPLPDAKAASVQRLGFGTVDKILLLYAEPWWERLWSKLHILWPPPPPSVVTSPESKPVDWAQGIYGFNPAPHGLGLECWLAGPSALAMEAESEADVIANLHQILLRCALFDNEAEQPPMPIGILRSTWGSKRG
eukprot:CAMPEP_0172914892 /NCGR_PEP_ID=MMETSP1075-20121228/193216_1 /TAXON_ID=2916 /ORGANISM="Ceratium fusus, Strain PA161109" /LENGTH=539 /DNA_ID=CAMNT_0013773871 /DNA_START=114 /DNA_END=1730 /DNA_ORIENTATION=-